MTLSTETSILNLFSVIFYQKKLCLNLPTWWSRLSYMTHFKKWF